MGRNTFHQMRLPKALSHLALNTARDNGERQMNTREAGFLSKSKKTYLFQVRMHLQCPSVVGRCTGLNTHRHQPSAFMKKAIPKWCYCTDFSGVTKWVQPYLSQLCRLGLQVLYTVEVLMVVQTHQ